MPPPRRCLPEAMPTSSDCIRESPIHHTAPPLPSRLPGISRAVSAANYSTGGYLRLFRRKKWNKDCVRPDEAAGLREIRLRALARRAGGVLFVAGGVRRACRRATGRSGRRARTRRCSWPWRTGNGSLSPGPSRRRKRWAPWSLWWLWVAPDARGRGLAGGCWRHGQSGPGPGVPAGSELAIAENNETVITFYRGLGFVPTGERRSMASEPTCTGCPWRGHCDRGRCGHSRPRPRR